MKARAARATQSLLVMALVVSLISSSARADDGSRGKPIQLYAAAGFGPIGKVAGNSLGSSSFLINGRMSHDEQIVWNGDLIEATTETSARVLLDSLGQVALRSGAQVRLATGLTKLDDYSTRRVLIASLISGDIAVNLHREAAAYIEACGSSFVATPGESFRIGVREGRAAVFATSSMVRTEPQITRRTYIVRSANPVLTPSRPIEARTGKTQEVAAKATKQETKTGSTRQVLFTPSSIIVQAAGEQPAPSKRVVFTLSRPIGLLNPTEAITDANGIARVFFTAGRNPDSADITATVADLIKNESLEENVIPWTARIIVVKAGFWTRNKILILAAGVAAAISVGIVKGKRPIKQVPPPVIP